MALKFLNKKGWHTGSLRNIETVWKAEQKHEGEQKKLEELRKQIQDEREKSEFRLMQEQAGLVPKQERLEFLYDSGLQVGKVAQADEYLLGKPLEETVQPENDVGQVAAKPGALFVEEKPASANDSWRKLHSDPLFLIKQQEQAAITRITSNPVKMAQIKKAAEMKKKLKEEKKKKRKEAKRERREKKKRKKHHVSSTEDSSDSDDPRKNRKRRHDSSDDEAGQKEKRAQLTSRHLSRSPTRSPVRKDRRQSPAKSRGEGREFEKRERILSKSRSRSPVLKNHDWGRSERDASGSRASYKLEGRQREHNANDKGIEGRSSERRRRPPSRSSSRSASRSPARRDHDQRSKKSYDRDFEKRKAVASRSPLRSRSRSPARRRSPPRREHDLIRSRRDDYDSRGRQSNERLRDERQNGPSDRDFEKRKRRRSPSRSPSRSPARRSPVRRDQDWSSSKRGGSDSRARQREEKISDERRKGSDNEKRKRARSLSNSRSRSPSPRSSSPSRARKDDLDSRTESMPLREQNSSEQKLNKPDEDDARPLDSTEREKGFKSSINGDSRSTERPAEAQVPARKAVNSLISRPGTKGRPPRPALQLSDAERAARVAEMQSNADVHEEQRWQRLKRAADADDAEAKLAVKDKSNEEFIADTQKSIYGAQEGSLSSTIEKSVKRRAHFIERSSADNERNAFRR